MARQDFRPVKAQHKLKRDGSSYSEARKKKRQQHTAVRKLRRSIQRLTAHGQCNDDHTEEEADSKDDGRACSIEGGVTPVLTEDADDSDDSHGPPIAFLTLKLHSATAKQDFRRIVKKLEQSNHLRRAQNSDSNKPLRSTKTNGESFTSTVQAAIDHVHTAIDVFNTRMQNLQHDFTLQAEALQNSLSHECAVAKQIANQQVIDGTDGSDDDDEEEDDADVLVRGVRHLTKAQWRAVDRVTTSKTSGRNKRLTTRKHGTRTNAVHKAATISLEQNQAEADLKRPRTRSQLRMQGKKLAYSKKMTASLNIVDEKKRR